MNSRPAQEPWFTFGKWIDYGKSHRWGEQFSLKGAWSGSRDPFKNFKPPSIFVEWMKLHCLNLASGSTTESPPRGKNPPGKGRGLDHVIVFGVKPRSLNLANASTMVNATPGVKNSLGNGCGVGHVTAV